MAEGLVLDIELIGGEALIKSLHPEMYLGPLNAEIRAITKRAQKTARSGFDSRSSVINAIQIENKSLQGRMFTVMKDNRTASIERGRVPGDNLLHPDALRPWARRSGVIDAIFELARAIQRRGVKGRFFIQAAVKEADRGLGRSVDKIANLVTKGFPKFK